MQDLVPESRLQWQSARIPGQQIRSDIQLDITILFFWLQKFTFGHNRFSTLFFSMKVAKSEKIVLASCIIDFKDIQI